MKQYPFIFSDEPGYRFKRHLLFWSTWAIFFAFLYSFAPINTFGSYWANLPASLLDSVVYLMAHMFLSYALMYYVIPNYLIKQRYWLTAVWVILVFFMAALLSVFLSFTIIPSIRTHLVFVYKGGSPRSIPNSFFYALMAGLRGAITVGGIAASIKLMKYWYVKEQRNLQLQKENTESQLQLLKAQVHPHFLFNTLNNIYSYTQNTAPVASNLVIGLSDMLRYMLYECNQPMVPLSKEIKLLKDYCSLEKVRYDNHLDLQVKVPANDTELLIAPLLFLPFVENCFKHGASNLLEDAWISLDIGLEGNRMKMKLVNSKPFEEKKLLKNKTGIGILNVKTRLELLYEGKYELTITNEPELFIVNLSIELKRQKSVPILTATEIKTAVNEPS